MRIRHAILACTNTNNRNHRASSSHPKPPTQSDPNAKNFPIAPPPFKLPPSITSIRSHP
ncbi:hypothetical protein [Kingella bonacorsii]|uniref:Uncharacterized protein n=1 Tax=Kingella bonacorsii TaxID=2796361 RepID=A0ABS1BSU2_9NEIS|nr:hypothetical protein [Kingella bonacorsii]MBK0396324.1 hypothetical protein [Kingella bonacorsii]